MKSGVMRDEVGAVAGGQPADDHLKRDTVNREPSRLISAVRDLLGRRAAVLRRLLVANDRLAEVHQDAVDRHAVAVSMRRYAADRWAWMGTRAAGLA